MSDTYKQIAAGLILFVVGSLLALGAGVQAWGLSLGCFGVLVATTASDFDVSLWDCWRKVVEAAAILAWVASPFVGWWVWG